MISLPVGGLVIGVGPTVGAGVAVGTTEAGPGAIYN